MAVKATDPGVVILLVVLGSLLLSLQALAHHGTNISYDHDKPVEFAI
jgi:hypothetical protein